MTQRRRNGVMLGIHSKNHYRIKPIDAFVNSSLILEDCCEKTIPCKIIGLNVYSQEALTFDILLSDGELFSYIPPHKVSSKGLNSIWNLEDLVYVNSPSIDITLNSLFDEIKVSCFIKKKSIWVEGTYKMTVDFVTENELLHMVELKDGAFAFLPNHKVKFKDMSEVNLGFDKYKKIRDTYKV